MSDYCPINWHVLFGTAFAFFILTLERKISRKNSSKLESITFVGGHMRYLLTLAMVMLLASPAYADPSSCRMEGPHNCAEQNEDQLMNITKNTIHKIQAEHPGHAFRTQNDDILDHAAQQQVNNVKMQNQQKDNDNFLASLMFWRD